MTYRIAIPLMVALAASGCTASDATEPMSSRTSPSVSVASTSRSGNDDNDGESSQRSGALHLTKECTTYLGRAGDYCTIASSNLKAIKLGSRVVYQKAAGPASLDTDVILYPPHSTDNLAFGHCALDFVTGRGHCSFAGGTGKFREFSASVAVACVGPTCALDGRYSFGSREEDASSQR